MHETELGLVGNAAQDTAWIFDHDFDFHCSRVDDLQSVGLAWQAEDEQRQRVIVDPKVISDWLDIF